MDTFQKNLSTAATKIEFSLNVFAEFVEFNAEMLPQSQQDTGNRGNLKIDPNSCFIQWIHWISPTNRENSLDKTADVLITKTPFFLLSIFIVHV